jgi:cell division protease FtsH
MAILRGNRELLESIAEKILEKEVIEGDDLKGLLASSVMPEDTAA